MLLRQKKLPHNELNEQLNRELSTEGKAKAAEEQQLQASVQGGLSDIVREHDKLAGIGELTDEQVEEDLSNWEQGLSDKSPSAPQTTKNRGGWQRVGKIVPGKGYVSVNK